MPGPPAAYGSTNATAANFAVVAVNFGLVELPVVATTGVGVQVRFTPAPVPEPAAVLALAAAGLAAAWSVLRASTAPTSAG